MAEPALNIPRMTVAEYREFERHANTKHEFVNGVVYAMTGTSKRHDVIGGDLFGVLLAHVQPPCIVYSANVKVSVEAQNADAIYYPDVHVSCSDLDNDPLVSEMPVLVVEVASASTAGYDRNEKFEMYKKRPSLQEYVIAQQKEVLVEVFRKQTGWEAERFGPGDSFTLECVQLALPVAQLYRRVKF